MDQIAVINLEIEKNDNKYVFSMPIGAPLGEAYDAAFLVIREIIKMADEAAKRKDEQSSQDDQESQEDKEGNSKEVVG